MSEETPEISKQTDEPKDSNDSTYQGPFSRTYQFVAYLFEGQPGEARGDFIFFVVAPLLVDIVCLPYDLYKLFRSSKSPEKG